jgi:Divergent InlB B-repeat domain
VFRLVITTFASLIVALATFGPASSGASGALPRSTVDRPDDRSGSQVHVLYVVPADGQDRALDTDGTIEMSVGSFQAWLRGQTGGRALRVDTFQGALDVSFVRLAESDAAIAANGAFVRDAIEQELRTRGFADPAKIYAVYYDGSSTFACGGGAWPPSLPGTVAALYLRATYGDGLVCYDPARSRAGLQLMDLALLHETLHTMGFVPACAPHHTRAGHTSDSPTDLMYAGDQPWVPSVLDVGRDDYFDAPVPGCPDLADSPFLAAREAVPLTVSVVRLDGSGTVTSAPTGIACPPTCSHGFERATEVVLTATPDDRSRFEGWRGACSGRDPCRLSLLQATSVEAVFAAASYRLAVVVTGSGRVVSAPPGIDCRHRCSTSFGAGSAVRLRAVPARRWRFAGWSGGCAGRRACVLRMDASRSVRARFRRA